MFQCKCRCKERQRILVVGFTRWPSAGGRGWLERHAGMSTCLPVGHGGRVREVCDGWHPAWISAVHAAPQGSVPSHRPAPWSHPSEWWVRCQTARWHCGRRTETWRHRDTGLSSDFMITAARITIIGSSQKVVWCKATLPPLLYSAHPNMDGSIVFARWRSLCTLRVTPHVTRFLGPTGVHNPNDISICSAIFAQLMAECLHACLDIFFPLKIAHSHGGSGPTMY